jgi:hypothetical protein
MEDIIYTTVVIAKHDETGKVKVFDRAESRWFNDKYTAINAFTYPKKEVEKLQKKYK